jgi:uncharacterized protein
MAGGLSLEHAVIILAAVAVGGAVQRSVGFGFALVAAPVLALLRPDALPATLLILALPLTAAMAVRERGAIDLHGFGRLTAGRLLGTAGGVVLLLAVPRDALSALFGALILAAVGLVAAPRLVPAGWQPRFTVGVASGVMGTAGSVGGPPLALLYRDRSGPELRSTLATSFLIGILISVAALALADRVAGWQALLALELLPALLGGLLVGSILARVADRSRVRSAILILAGVSGLAALVQGLLG